MSPIAWLGLVFAAMLGAAVALFRRYYMPPEVATPNPAPMPIPATPAPSTAPIKPDMLTVFCTAIRDFEGKPGDLNYLLNNPGDCRPSPVGYLPQYQPVVVVDTDTDPKYPYHKGKFAKFPSYAIGWLYLTNMVHFMAVNHPNWTILDFFTNFAPSNDANPTLHYAQTVASKCGVSTGTTLQELLG